MQMARAGPSQERGGAGILVFLRGGPSFSPKLRRNNYLTQSRGDYRALRREDLIFISTEYRRKGDWDIATTSSIEMVNDIVRDGL